MRYGKIDDISEDYVNFKRQNITKWGVLSHLM